jgi:hypothetical protein
MLFVFIYVYRCPTRFPYQMLCLSFNSNLTDVTCRTETANPSRAPNPPTVFSGIHVAFNFLGNVWPLCCLQFTASDYPSGIFKLFKVHQLLLNTSTQGFMIMPVSQYPCHLGHHILQIVVWKHSCVILIYNMPITLRVCSCFTDEPYNVDMYYLKLYMYCHPFILLFSHRMFMFLLLFYRWTV